MKDQKSGSEIVLAELPSKEPKIITRSMNQAWSHTGQESPKGAKLAKLMDTMKTLTEQKFTGYIKINFTQGGIGRVEKFEEILK